MSKCVLLIHEGRYGIGGTASLWMPWRENYHRNARNRAIIQRVLAKMAEIWVTFVWRDEVNGDHQAWGCRLPLLKRGKMRTGAILPGGILPGGRQKYLHASLDDVTPDRTFDMVYFQRSNQSKLPGQELNLIENTKSIMLW